MPRPPVKAQSLADLLADLIRGGDPAPGQWLPSERQLADMHGAGRSTVRQAIQLLVDAGLVERHDGSGVRVRAVEVGPVPPGDVHSELKAIRSELREMHELLRTMTERDVPPTS
ncbi:MAG TPA: winged helix-turn-helix domain-containing protein [Pseudonocardiaceae bacterium]